MKTQVINGLNQQWGAIMENAVRKVNKERNTNIEALKLLAILLIIIFHIVQTLTDNPNVTKTFWVWNATEDVTTIILSIIRGFGVLGNSIFFMCSAYFLLNSKKSNKKKIIYMIIEIFSVSILILLISQIPLWKINISKEIRFQSLFPTTYSTNWYLTCYILLYLICPILNYLIKNINKKQLLVWVSFMSFLFIGINFMNSGAYFSNNLILWITIYLIMAYIKLYCDKFSRNNKAIYIILFSSMVLHLILMIATNELGLHHKYFYDKVMKWNNNNNPFFIAIAMSLVFIAINKKPYVNKFLNKIASYSLLIYIIHENIILRTYVRPQLINFIYAKWGYNKLFLEIFILAIFIYACSIILSIIYTFLFKRLLGYLTEKIYNLLCKFENKYVNLVMRIK